MNKKNIIVQYPFKQNYFTTGVEIGDYERSHTPFFNNWEFFSEAIFYRFYFLRQPTKNKKINLYSQMFSERGEEIEKSFFF